LEKNIQKPLAFSLAVLAIMIAFAIAGSGAGLGETQFFEQGSGTAVLGTTSVTFPVPFNDRNVKELVNVKPVTPISGPDRETTSYVDMTGINSTGPWWDWRIPSAETEWLGIADGNTRKTIRFDGVNSLSLEVWIHSVGAVSAFNAFLNLQYSLDAGSTWTDLFSGHLNVGTFDVNDCLQTSATGIPCEAVADLNNLQINFPALFGVTNCSATSTTNCPLVRLIGSGGNGATQVQLGQVLLKLGYLGSVADVFVWHVVNNLPGNGPPFTGFQFFIETTFSSGGFTGTFAYNWTAWVCINGASSC
jgi:hypothetical protein